MWERGNPGELNGLKGSPQIMTNANLYFRVSHALCQQYLPSFCPQHLLNTGIHNTDANMNTHSNIHPYTNTSWFSSSTQFASLFLKASERKLSVWSLHEGFTIPVCTLFPFWVYSGHGIKGWTGMEGYFPPWTPNRQSRDWLPPPLSMHQAQTFPATETWLLL